MSIGSAGGRCHAMATIEFLHLHAAGRSLATETRELKAENLFVEHVITGFFGMEGCNGPTNQMNPGVGASQFLSGERVKS